MILWGSTGQNWKTMSVTWLLYLPQASDVDELQQLQMQLDVHKEAEEKLNNSLAEAKAALRVQEEQGQQAERQLAQMVESQRRLGQELQEGVEAREDAEAQKDQAQVQDAVEVALCAWLVNTAKPWHNLGLSFSQTLTCASGRSSALTQTVIATWM